MNGDFNPNSHDAMFSKVLERLSEQEVRREKMHAELRSFVEDILIEARKTNGRVSELEKQRWIFQGQCAGISVGLVAVWEWIRHSFLK